MLETVLRGSLSRNGFLAKSNGLRYGGCALKGLSEGLRFHDDCRRLDRPSSASAYGKRRPQRRVTLPPRQALADFGVCPRAHWTHLTVALTRSRRWSPPAGVLCRRNAGSRKRVIGLTAAL